MIVKPKHKELINIPEVLYGKISERDMDLLFSETLASDIEFVQLFLEKADIKYKRISVEHVELSHTEADLVNQI